MSIEKMRKWEETLSRYDHQVFSFIERLEGADAEKAYELMTEGLVKEEFLNEFRAILPDGFFVKVTKPEMLEKLWIFRHVLWQRIYCMNCLLSD